MQNSTSKVRVLTGTAMLGAVAAVLMYLEFPIPIMPAFVKLDVSELPALIASFAYGPVSGILVCLIKNLIKLPSTSTAAPHRVRLRRSSKMPMQPSAVGMALYTVSSGRAK